MIELSNVTYAPAGQSTVCLDSASITLPTNRRLALLGAPGAGKSSIIKLLAGTTQPQVGVIERRARVSFPLGFSGGFRAKTSIRENLRHLARVYGADETEVVEFVAAVTNIANMRVVTLGELAPQERTKLAYASCYAIPFDTYLIDNRIACGDQTFRSHCEQMFKLRTESAGAIVATGRANFARQWCDSAAVLDRGKITLFEQMDDAFEEFERILSSPDAYTREQRMSLAERLSELESEEDA